MAFINADIKIRDEVIAPIAAAPQPCLLDAVRQGSEGIADSGTAVDWKTYDELSLKYYLNF